jgi:hypothetical protein|tara:strand:+ start:410 stop:1057 length:648 start_codon:yes stop_codon:yes gene_type:complete
MFDIISRSLGSTLLSTMSAAPSDSSVSSYDFISQYTDKPGIEAAESQLTRRLFKLPEMELGGEAVFNKTMLGDREVLTISESDYGKSYQNALNRYLNEEIRLASDAYEGAEKVTRGAGEEFLTAYKKKMLSANPDTGEPSFKIREGVLGDIHLNPTGEFNDYWNIGLDRDEKIDSILNLKRALAAPFTDPPTVSGSIDIDEDLLPFYTKLFEDRK